MREQGETVEYPNVLQSQNVCPERPEFAWHSQEARGSLCDVLRFFGLGVIALALLYWFFKCLRRSTARQIRTAPAESSPSTAVTLKPGFCKIPVGYQLTIVTNDVLPFLSSCASDVAPADGDRRGRTFCCSFRRCKLATQQNHLEGILARHPAGDGTHLRSLRDHPSDEVTFVLLSSFIALLSSLSVVFHSDPVRDEDEQKVLSALEEAGVFDAGLNPNVREFPFPSLTLPPSLPSLPPSLLHSLPPSFTHSLPTSLTHSLTHSLTALFHQKVLFCETELGRAAMVRQIEPMLHVESSSLVLESLKPFIPNLVPRLYPLVIPSGCLPFNAVLVLSSATFLSLVALLSSLFSQVVVKTPYNASSLSASPPGRGGGNVAIVDDLSQYFMQASAPT
eukprot:763695-Hanusia_phi.AAC.8